MANETKKHLRDKSRDCNELAAMKLRSANSVQIATIVKLAAKYDDAEAFARTLEEETDVSTLAGMLLLLDGETWPALQGISWSDHVEWLKQSIRYKRERLQLARALVELSKVYADLCPEEVE